MSKIIKYLPELQDEEQMHVATLFRDMTEEQAEQFTRVYRQRRKEANITLVTALLGFLVVAGVHRFYLGQMGMGLLYFFTGGLCAIGTIVDVFNHKSLTYKFNEKQALDVAALVTGAFPDIHLLEDE
ncbi:MAG: TM2 domain-containing membrane protein YozV [Rhodothermales bacterium]|jgi:TM2 domain-containing membrane protein YozV